MGNHTIDERDSSIGPLGHNDRSFPSNEPGLVDAEPDDFDMVCLADVRPVPITWVWPDRIARGKLTLIAGDPGLGKSFITLDFAAVVTTGRPWPDAPYRPTKVGSVILLNAEDALDDTISPRLIAAGSDMSRVHSFKCVRRTKGKATESLFDLSKDLARLEKAIRKYGDVLLVIIDPISAYIGTTDDHKNGDVRGLLAPLADLAERLKVAILLVSHLNKNIGGKALQRVMGSMAYVAAVRSAFLVHEDPNDPRRRLMLHAKNNNSSKFSGLAFRIIDGAVRWEPLPVEMTANQLLAAEEQAAKAETNVDRAANFLVKFLGDGPRSHNDVIEGGDAEGFGRSTLNRAKSRAGVRSDRSGFGEEGRWMWSLAPSPPVVAEDTQPENLDTFDSYGGEAFDE